MTEAEALFELSDHDGSPASAEFKLSITRAMADQLADKLAKLKPVPLSTGQLEKLRELPGVYELYLDGSRVYVGKSSKSLPDRLGNHLRKLSGRFGIDLATVGFICLYVDEDLEAAAPEKLLIKKYRGGGGVPWNTMGFGNKDPGRNRDHSLVKAAHFDARYPIDLDRVVTDLYPGSGTVETFVNQVKGGLPYNLRFETKKPIKKELAATPITVRSTRLTARGIMRLTIEALPEGWQATALPGYLILYHEAEEYNSAIAFWRKEDGHVREFRGRQRFNEKDKVDLDRDGEDETEEE